MVETRDIVDRNSLKSWLQDQPREVGIILATRAALRALPLFWEWTLAEAAAQPDLTALYALRSVVTSLVGASIPNDDVKNASTAAARVARAEVARVASAPSAADAASASATSAAAAAAADAVYTASAAAARAARAVQAAGSNSTSERIWVSLRRDSVLNLHEIFSQPLWEGRADPLNWAELKASLLAKDQSESSVDWSFWVTWYDEMMHGKARSEREWEMLKEIVLIEDEHWEKGPAHINPMIGDIVERYGKSEFAGIEREDDDDLRSTLPPLKNRIETVKQALVANRDNLPPTLDGIEGFILLEIQRLQTLNYESDVHQEECRRQIHVLLTLHSAVERMRAQIPTTNEVTTESAIETEKLLTLYMRKLAELPREKADVVVEGIWQTGRGVLQGGLILGSTALFSYFSLPAMAGVATGSLLFAPDKASAIIKAAKETVLPIKP